MDEERRDAHGSGECARSRETNLFVDRTEIALTSPTGLAHPVRNDTFDDDERARGTNRGDGLAEATNPLVTEHQGITDVGGVDRRVDQLEVSAAQTHADGPHQHLVGSDDGLGPLAHAGTLRLIDDEGPHRRGTGRTPPSIVLSRSACSRTVMPS